MSKAQYMCYNYLACRAWAHSRFCLHRCDWSAEPHLIELQHSRSLDKGLGLGYMHTTILGVKGLQVPYHAVALEHPYVIIMAPGNCTDLA